MPAAARCRASPPRPSRACRADACRRRRRRCCSAGAPAIGAPRTARRRCGPWSWSRMCPSSIAVPVQGIVFSMTLPPGPRGPAVLQSLRLILEPIGFLDRCLRRYGDVFTLRFVGMGDLVYVADTDVVRDIFTGDPSVFRAGEANEVMEPVLGARSVLLLDGEDHLRERRMLLPPFHGERVRTYRELVAEIAAAEVERWPRGTPISMRPRMQAITLEVILRAVFGIREADRLSRLRELVPRLLDHGTVIVWMPFLRRDF